MLHFFKKNIGVTLIEVMLVLFVSSLIALAAFQYQKTRNENAIAAEYAERMYDFSQAVRMYTNDFEAELATGLAPPFTSADAPGSTFTQNGTDYIFTGTDWLTVVNSPVTGTPYLPKTFTFDDLQPLQVQRTPSGGGTPWVGSPAIQVNIAGATTSGAQIMIEYGALYDVADATKPPIPKSVVTAKAAKLASSFSDPLMGPSSFNYVGGTVDATGVMLPIVATIKSSTVFGENYLRLDGTNSMLDNITFDVANATNRDVKDLANIVFDTTNVASGGIQSVKSIAFDTTSAASGTIKSVKSIQFDKTADNTQISDIDVINMDSTYGNINGVKSIKFENISTLINLNDIQFVAPFGLFRGIKVSAVARVLGNDNDPLLPQATSFCFLTAVTFRDKVSGEDKDRKCQVYTDLSATSHELIANNAENCEATCVTFR